MLKNLPAKKKKEKKKRICLQCSRPRFDPWVRKIPWRREWLPTPVSLPGEFHGQRSLADCSPWGRRESDKTEQLTLSLFFFFFFTLLRLLTATTLQVLTAFPLCLWQRYQDWILWWWQERRMAASSQVFGLAGGRSQKSGSRGRLREFNSQWDPLLTGSQWISASPFVLRHL